MTKMLLLKVHRWISLVFALPLLVIIVTGLILSFEPMRQASGVTPGRVDAAQVIDLVRRLDPQNTARGLAINAAGHRLRLQGVDVPEIYLATGQAATAGDSTAALFLWARRTHERLIGQSWLVIASTIAMLTIMTLGAFMGLPRLRNTLSGWHKGMAWFTLPLIVLSPLTGLCLAFGLTFQGAAPPSGGKPLPLPEAIRLVSQSRDLSQVVSIGTRGGRMMARLMEDGELRAYTFTADGLTALPRNWPRLIHEGNWSAMIGAPLNVLISVVLLGLLGTGVVIWARRRLRRPAGGRDSAARGSIAAGSIS